MPFAAYAEYFLDTVHNKNLGYRNFLLDWLQVTHHYHHAILEGKRRSLKLNKLPFGLSFWEQYTSSITKL